MERKKKEIKLKAHASESRASSLLECYAECSRYSTELTAANFMQK